MYTTALFVHSWLRWVVLILGLIAAGRALTAGRRQWTRTDHQVGVLFGITLDIQMLLGLILYFLLSPFTREALQDVGAAMKNSGLRFWAVEHPFGMIVALALVHIGNARIRKTYDDRRKHRLAAIFFTLALLIMLVTIPWPGLANGRPLFRW
jgi:hypothetical protein